MVAVCGCRGTPPRMPMPAAVVGLTAIAGLLTVIAEGFSIIGAGMTTACVLVLVSVLGLGLVLALVLGFRVRASVSVRV